MKVLTGAQKHVNCLAQGFKCFCEIFSSVRTTATRTTATGQLPPGQLPPGQLPPRTTAT